MPLNLSTPDRRPTSGLRRYRLLWNIAGQLVMVSALIFLGVRLIGSGQQVLSDVRRVHAAPLAGAGLLTLAMLLLMPLGWNWALRAVGAPLSLRASFVIYYRVSVLRYLPGSIWNFPGRAYLSQQRGVPLAAFAQGTFWELFFLLAAAGALAGWGLALYLRAATPLILSALALAAMLAAIVWPRRWWPAWLKTVLAPAPPRRRFLLGLMAIYMAVWWSYGVAVVLLLTGLPGTQPIEALYVIPVTTAAWVGGFLSPSPAGMGVRELGLSTMVGPGLSTAVIVVSLIQRAMELLLEGLLWAAASLTKA